LYNPTPENIKNICYIITGTIIIITFFYIRLILERKPYLLIDERLTPLTIPILLLIILIHVIIIYVTLKHVFFKKQKKTSNKYMLFLQKIIMELFWKPLNYIYEKIAPDLPYSGIILVKYAHYFIKQNQVIQKSIPLIFYFMPRILISLSFFIELVFYNRVHFFVYLIHLIFLVLGYGLFLKLSQDFVTRNTPIILEGLIITPLGPPNVHGVQTSHKFEFTLEYVNLGYTLEYLDDRIEGYETLTYLTSINNVQEEFISKYRPHVSLFCSSLYVLSFLYKIIHIFL